MSKSLKILLVCILVSALITLLVNRIWGAGFFLLLLGIFPPIVIKSNRRKK